MEQKPKNGKATRQITQENSWPEETKSALAQSPARRPAWPAPLKLP